MPRKPPAEPIDHHYDIPRLNRSFFWTGGILTAVFIVDGHRGLLARLEDDPADLHAPRRQADARGGARRAQEGARRGAREAGRRAEGGPRAEIARSRRGTCEGQAKLRDLDPQIYAADQHTSSRRRPSTRRSTSTRTRWPTSRRRPRPHARSAGRLTARSSTRWTLRLAELKTGADAAVEHGDRPHQRAAQKRSRRRSSGGRRTSGWPARSTEACKQDTLFKLRNSPILDMINPSLRVQQVQLPDHFINVNFMRIPRVDRCTTCHVAAGPEGVRGSQDPRRSTELHPADAPHGRQRVDAPGDSPSAARPCHGGRDRATSFWSAGHSPETEAERRSLDPEVRLDVRPVQRDARSCRSSTPRPAATAATPSETNFPEAPTLDAGMRIVESPRAAGAATASTASRSRASRRSGRRSSGSPRRSRATGPRAGSWIRRRSGRTRRCRRSSISRTSSTSRGRASRRPPRRRR